MQHDDMQAAHMRLVKRQRAATTDTDTALTSARVATATATRAAATTDSAADVAAARSCTFLCSKLALV